MGNRYRLRFLKPYKLLSGGELPPGALYEFTDEIVAQEIIKSGVAVIDGLVTSAEVTAPPAPPEIRHERFKHDV